MNSKNVLKSILVKGRFVVDREFGKAEYDNILNYALEEYETIVPSAPQFNKLGNRVLFMLAVPIAALYRVFTLKYNIDDKRAQNLILEMVLSRGRWLFNHPIIKGGYNLLYDTNPGRRIVKKLVLDLNEPDGWKFVPAEEGVLSFRIQRCGIYEFFKKIGMEHLAWIPCEVDYLTDDILPIKLVRDSKISNNDKECHFVYIRK